MKIPFSVQTAIKAILIPLIAVVGLNVLNIFDYVTIVPQEYKFEFGLTIYLAICEAIWEGIKRKCSSLCATINCIFYTKEEEKTIKNTPTIICGASTMNVSKIKCQILLNGNPDYLYKSKLQFSLPEWLSSQVPSSNRVLKYENNLLTLHFDRVIVNNGQKSISISQIIEIPFIQNADDEFLSITLRPQLLLDGFAKWLVCFDTNEIKICNREVH